jgi:VWFA-related protein
MRRPIEKARSVGPTERPVNLFRTYTQTVLCDFFLVILVIGPGQISRAQEPQSAPSADQVETLHTSTRLVVLDVVVTDKGGNPVKNLTKDDFTIVEDNASQSVAAFEAPEADSSSPSTRVAKDKSKDSVPTASRPATERALNIIVLDELNSEFLDQAHARVAIDKFLRSQGPRLSSPTALLILGQKRLEVLHDYTQESGALLEALKKRHAEMPSTLMSAEMYSSGERFNQALAGLNLIADANRNYAGRKNVIWIGPGFPALNSDFYDRPQEVGGAVRDVGNVLLDARIVVYTLDPRGLEVTPVSYNGHDPGGQVESQLLFEQIAPETGGRILRIRNDIDVAIADSIKDGSFYYTLSYYPSNRAWNGKFRKVKIVMKRDGLVARTRLGYFSFAATPANDQQLDTILSRAVVNPLSYRALNVQAFVKGSGTQAGSRNFKIYVGRNHLNWQTLPDGDHRCEVTVVEASVAPSGKVIAHTVKELEGIVAAKKFSKDWEKPMAFEMSADVPAGTTHLRLVVRDNTTGDMGTTDLAAQARGMSR